jgi:acyl-CoA thioester hydrolase
MVGSAMLAIEVTKTDIATAIATANMARHRCGGGNPSATSNAGQRIGPIAGVCLTPCHFVNKLPAMEFPQFEGTVLPEWIDANGHMNLAYYVVLFDQATDLLYDALGVGNTYRDATGHSTFTAETHTLYEREVSVGERVRVVPHLLAADTKRLHYFHEMFRVQDDLRVAAQELIALHIDMSVRRVTPFPAELYARIQATLRARTNNPMPAGVGRRIAMPS